MANNNRYSPYSRDQYPTDNNVNNNYKTVEYQLNKLYDSECTVSLQQRTKERTIKDELLECIRNKQKQLQNKDSRTLSPLEKKAQRCPTIWESQTIVGGSRMKRLALEGSDYDLLVAFSPTLVQNVGHSPDKQYELLDKEGKPHIAHKELHSFICLVRSAMKDYSPKVQVVKTRVSAEVSGYQGLSFDVLPSYRLKFEDQSTMEFIQSRAQPEKWEDCHRYEELSQVTDYKQKFPEYTKCVRLLKLFRDLEKFDLPSFALQRLVENYVDTNVLQAFPLVECIRYCLNLLRKGLEGTAAVEDSFAKRDLLENLRTKPKKAEAKASILAWITRILNEIEQGKLSYYS